MQPHRDGQVSPEARLRTRTCPVPDVSFRAFLAGRPAPRLHWAAPDGLEVAASGAAARVSATGPDRFDTVREEAAALFADVETERWDAGESLRDAGNDRRDANDARDDAAPPATKPRLFGGFAFHDGHERTSPWEGFPGASFVLPRVQLTRTDDETWLTVAETPAGTDATASAARPDDDPPTLETVRETVADLPRMEPAGTPPGVAATHHTDSREQWCEQVRGVVERIRAGDLQKVTLATALDVDLEAPVSIPDVLERLRTSYPDCFRFLVEPDEAGGFFGAPPERLVSLDGRHVVTEALAGSVARGDTPEEDDDFAAELTESEKVREEHELVAETIRDRLEPLAEAVDVGERGLRRLSTIQHLETPITADLGTDGHVLDVVEALHPTPAVGGLPPEDALATIRETETFDRGWYAAPVGWFDADGDGTFAVGIRSGVAAEESATLFGGNGIVADSDPAAEWDVVQLKFLPILDELE